MTAYGKRMDDEWQRTAWQTALIINIWLDKKDRVTVKDLLPKRHAPKGGPVQTVEKQIKIAEAWVAVLGGVDMRQEGGAGSV